MLRLLIELRYFSVLSYCIPLNSYGYYHQLSTIQECLLRGIAHARDERAKGHGEAMVDGGRRGPLFQFIPIPLDDRLCLRTTHELHQGFRRRIFLSLRQQNHVLLDRFMEIDRHIPATSLTLHLRIHDLGQGQKAQFGIAGLDEPQGLTQILPHYKPRLYTLP